MEQYLTPMGPTKLHVNPIFEIGPLEPRFSEWLVFEGRRLHTWQPLSATACPSQSSSPRVETICATRERRPRMRSSSSI